LVCCCQFYPPVKANDWGSVPLESAHTEKKKNEEKEKEEEVEEKE